MNPPEIFSKVMADHTKKPREKHYMLTHFFKSRKMVQMNSL